MAVSTTLINQRKKANEMPPEPVARPNFMFELATFLIILCFIRLLRLGLCIGLLLLVEILDDDGVGEWHFSFQNCR